MIDITFKCRGNSYEFQLESYNQLIVSRGMNLYLSLFERFNDLNAIKYDDYIGNLFESSIIVNGKKITKSNVLFIDFSNPDAILKNLSFDKTSIIRKNYINDLSSSIKEDDYEKLINQIQKIVDNSNVELTSKEPVIEKIFDLFYEGSNKSIEDLLTNYSTFVDHITKFRNENEGIFIFILTDSFHKYLDIKSLKNISNLFILDRCTDVNKFSNNFLHFNEEIVVIEKSNLVTSIVNNWPSEISETSVQLLLQKYFSICMCGKINDLEQIEAEAVVLYYTLAKLLEFKPEFIIGEMYIINIEKYTDYIENLV